MTQKETKVWGFGQLKIFDMEMDSFILEDGTPMLSLTAMTKALGRPIRWSRSEDLPAVLDAQNLQPFIREDLKQKLIPLEYGHWMKKLLLYDADILPMICNVYLEARQIPWLLTAKQQLVAHKCEILLMAFARVGIRALIYEQLGYEKMKHPDAFRMLIESYLSEEVRKWSKEFPDELFVQMDRIYGNAATTSRNRPLYYAKFIRKYIYDPIEWGKILEVLDEKNPSDDKWHRTNRHHTLLNEQKWLQVLRSQIRQVIWALKISSNKGLFERNYKKLMWENYQPSLFEDIL